MDQVTDNEQLEIIATSLLPKKFKGVYSQDTVPDKPGYYIVNTDLYGKPGVHWVGVVITRQRVYVWDSFGRSSNKLLKALSKNSKIANKLIVDADYDPEQKISEMLCGQISLAWLLTVDEVGIKNALKV